MTSYEYVQVKHVDIEKAHFFSLFCRLCSYNIYIEALIPRVHIINVTMKTKMCILSIFYTIYLLGLHNGWKNKSYCN